ncbi:MAG: hypothetical protein RL160_643 [Bacteroidota bacterium]
MMQACVAKVMLHPECVACKIHAAALRITGEAERINQPWKEVRQGVIAVLLSAALLQEERR